VVVPQSSEQKTCRFGIGVPFFHSSGVAELGKPLKKANESFTQSPISLAKRVSQVLPTWFWTVVGAAVSRIANST
jgi:hypothetical protein